ncbi:MAG: Holliday junction resolvase RuvX [Bifidobacteriaceae bacterium]|nr:Holliday junction resolvase RuvX [Bifidobacteriaceae bacterium]
MDGDRRIEAAWPPGPRPAADPNRTRGAQAPDQDRPDLAAEGAESDEARQADVNVDVDLEVDLRKPRPGPWLGVDLGQVRIGLALSDPGLVLAMPLATIDRAGRSIDALAGYIATLAVENKAWRVIVGWPLNMDGTSGPKAAEAAALAAALEVRGVPSALQDERRTTAQASAQLRAAGRSAKQQRQVIDQAAAVLILQAALDTAP